MPNERFEEFADRFMKSIGEPGCDLQALVDELIELHAVERDEFNRVRLISMHIALTNIAAEGLAKAQGPGSSLGFLADNLTDNRIAALIGLRGDRRGRAFACTDASPNAKKGNDLIRPFAEGGE
jgi:hypothetical protein